MDMIGIIWTDKRQEEIMSDTIGHSIVLVPETDTYATNVAHTTTVKTKYKTEGTFILEVSQASYSDETIDVDIEVYDLLTDDWYVIASFTQVTDASSTAQQELINIPYGLGEKISCEWTITGGDSTNKYTLTVSGTLK